MLCPLSLILFKKNSLIGSFLELRNFVISQLYHKRKSQWNTREKKLALWLFYKSPALYKYLRSLKFKLPGVRTIQRWLENNNLSTGINNSFFRNLKYKVSTMTEHEKECVLLFDETHIKTCLEYNRKKDVVEGFQDLGELGRSSRVANQVLVFMVRGLIYKWKLPISFYVSKSITFAGLKELVILNIKKCFEVCLKIRAITCDQGPSNQGLFKLLKITDESPYFTVDDKKIYGLFDVPHLIKNVRNN